MAKRGLDETRKFAEAARNMPRNRRFKSRIQRSGIDAIEDPREAAAVMLMEVARAAGEVTAEHKATMRAEMMLHFELDEQEAEDLVVAAGWLGRDEFAPHVVMQKMSRLVLNSPGLGPEQFVDLTNMLDEVALVSGGPVEQQVSLIGIFRKQANLRV